MEGPGAALAVRPAGAGTSATAAPGAALPPPADASTPLVRDCWYVAALSDELGAGPLAAEVTGIPLVLFRDSSGRPVALHDRCPHRGFPLSRGHVACGTIRCGYHGIRFAADGHAVEIPSDDRAAARAAMRVRAVPLVERPPFLWVWPGRADRADPAAIPEHPWLADPAWAHASGQTDIAANYLGLHENLLDTTHFSFLHAGNVGTLAYASAPIELSVEGDRVRQRRVLDGDLLPALYDRPMDLLGRRVRRVTDSHFVSPGWHIAHAEVVDPDPAPGRPVRYRTKILHAITPTAQHRTRYWWAIARDYRVEEPEVTEMQREAIIAAFEEDRVALEWIADLAAREAGSGWRERSLRPDLGGLAMRRIVARLAAAERAGPKETAA